MSETFLSACYGDSWSRWLPEYLINSAKRTTWCCEGLNGHVYNKQPSSPTSGLRCRAPFQCRDVTFIQLSMKPYRTPGYSVLLQQNAPLRLYVVVNIDNLVIWCLKYRFLCWHGSRAPLKDYNSHETLQFTGVSRSAYMFVYLSLGE